jgi:hypothetical protein
VSKRSRRPQARKPAPPKLDLSDLAAEDAAVDSTPTDDQSDEFVAPVWQHDLLSVEPDPVDERQLKALMSTWRRGRATKRLSQVLQDGYVAVFSVIVILAMLGGAVWRAQGNASACESTTCQVGRTLLPWVMLCAAFSLTLVCARIFGPVVASAAEGFWLMDAPIRRARLLRRRLIGVLVAVALGATAMGALLAALTGYDPPRIVQWAAALGLGAAGLTAFSALEQTFARTWLIKLVQWLSGLSAFVALATITAVAAGWVDLTFDDWGSNQIVIAVALVGAVLLLVFGLAATLRLDQIHRARLVSGGSLVSGMQGAMFAMDLGLMRDILVARESMAKGHVRPTYGVGRGLSALVWREVQRLYRYPKRLVLWFVSLGVPFAVGALGLRTFSPFISALVLLIAFVPLLGSLRVVTRTRGLIRGLPFSNPQIRIALSAVAAFLALLWSVIAFTAFYGLGQPVTSFSSAATTSVLTAAAGLLAAVRWVTAKSADYSNPMMQVGFGAMPPGLMFNLIKGIDIVVVVTGPLLLGWSHWISVFIVGVVIFALSGRFNTEEMQQMQAELQKEKAAQKSGGPRKVIAPPKR